MNEEMNNNYESNGFEQNNENQHISYNSYVSEDGADTNAGASYGENTGAEAEAPFVQPQQPAQNYEMPKKHKKNGTAAKVAALALCCAMVGGVCGGALGAKIVPQNAKASASSTVLQGTRENTVIGVKNIDTSKELTAAEVYAQNVNSTVGITTSITSTNLWGYQTKAAASGSGFIISADGYIITNYHVIEEAESVKVTTYSGESYDATIVGYDESNDIAVLKIDAEGLSPVVIGDSDNMNVGDSVVAIGNPLGELTFSLTSGAISALDREITLSSGVTMDLIQTDCAINSGNSGGALFNLYGEVIGITNAKYSSSGSSSEASIDNIGFAIPINSVRSIVESIIKNGYIVKPYIGVSVEDVSSEMTSYGLPAGAVVRSVTDGAPAAQAGLQANDIITAVDGTEISGSNDLVQIVTAKKAGDTLKFSVYRQGQTLELTVTVAEQKQSALEGSSDTQQSQQQDQSQQDQPPDRDPLAPAAEAKQKQKQGEGPRVQQTHARTHPPLPCRKSPGEGRAEGQRPQRLRDPVLPHDPLHRQQRHQQDAQAVHSRRQQQAQSDLLSRRFLFSGHPIPSPKHFFWNSLCHQRPFL